MGILCSDKSINDSAHQTTQYPTLLPISSLGIIYASNPRYVAQRLHSSDSTETPRRHLPLPIERDQENMPWQNRTIPTITRCAKNIQ